MKSIAAKPDHLRRVLGYLPQDFGVYPNLSAAEFLRYLAAAKGLPAGAAARRIDELLAAVHLAEARGRKLGGFSGGMRQRVGIAQALLNDPRLLIVDEPTVGLDPKERVGFRHLLSELGGERVVILSTHIVSDVEAVADRIVVMAGGGWSPTGCRRSCSPASPGGSGAGRWPPPSSPSCAAATC